MTAPVPTISHGHAKILAEIWVDPTEPPDGPLAAFARTGEITRATVDAIVAFSDLFERVHAERGDSSAASVSRQQLRLLVNYIRQHHPRAPQQRWDDMTNGDEFVAVTRRVVDRSRRGRTAVRSAWERLGRDDGERLQVLDRVVATFYDYVWADRILFARYYRYVDREWIERHQRVMVEALMRDTRYRGRHMAEAHQPLQITPDDFYRLVGHLVHALEQCNLSAELVGLVANAAAVYKPDIVTT